MVDKQIEILIVVLATLVYVPNYNTPIGVVDRLEFNHVYNNDGQELFVQAILWHEQKVVAWWWKKSIVSVERDFSRKVYIVRIIDDYGNFVIAVRSIDESFTQWDVEVENRDVVPMHKRDTSRLRRNNAQLR